MEYKYFLPPLRPINLFIIGFTQILLYQKLIANIFPKYDILPLLSLTQILVISLITVLIAGAGYIVNDLLDIEIDKVNKPHKVVFEKYIPKKIGWIYYYLLVFAGAIIAFWMALQEDELQRYWMYPLAVLCMYWYATKLKCSVLWGNLLVSIFCGGVTLIILYIEKDGWRLLPTDVQSYVFFTFIGYSGFAFLSNFTRELVKDIEDLEGDTLSNCQTLPQKYGVSTTKAWIFGTLFILFLSLAYWLLSDIRPALMVARGYIFIFMLVPTVVLAWLIYKAKKTEDFKRVSKLCKLLMFNGVVYLFFL